MSDDFESLDDEIKKLVAKADKIVLAEQLQQDRLETLTALREEDGRIKIQISKKKDELVEKLENLQIARSIWDEHEKYLNLLQEYSDVDPQTLQEILHENIEGYNWAEYSKIQDRLYKVTRDKSEEELVAEIEDLKGEIEHLESRRSDLVDNALLIIREIDARIEEVS